MRPDSFTSTTGRSRVEEAAAALTIDPGHRSAEKDDVRRITSNLQQRTKWMYVCQPRLGVVLILGRVVAGSLTWKGS
jgi:hypothetical protein